MLWWFSSWDDKCVSPWGGMGTEIQAFHVGVSSFRCAESRSAVLSSRPGLCLTAWLKEHIGGRLTSAGLADVEIVWFLCTNVTYLVLSRVQTAIWIRYHQPVTPSLKGLVSKCYSCITLRTRHVQGLSRVLLKSKVDWVAWNPVWGSWGDSHLASVDDSPRVQGATQVCLLGMRFIISYSALHIVNEALIQSSLPTCVCLPCRLAGQSKSLQIASPSEIICPIRPIRVKDGMFEK